MSLESSEPVNETVDNVEKKEGYCPSCNKETKQTFESRQFQ